MVWAGNTMPYEMFGVMTVYCGMIFMTFIMMFLTPHKDFVPIKQRKPPNKHQFSSWTSSGLALVRNLFAPVVTYLLEQLPCSHLQPKALCRNTGRGCGGHLFTLRLQRKGYWLWHGRGPRLKPPDPVHCELSTDLIALSSRY